MSLGFIRIQNRQSPPDAILYYPRGTAPHVLQQLPHTKRDAINLNGIYCIMIFPTLDPFSCGYLGVQATQALHLLGADPPPPNANADERKILFLEFLGI